MNLIKTLFSILLASLLPLYALAQQPFITTWKTDNPGVSCNSCITIPTTGGGYNYDVDWNNDGVFDEFGINGDVTHDFGSPGTYTIRIQGDFPRIHFDFSGDRFKILSIDQWGDIAWTSMEEAFSGCENLTYNAMDAPDLSNVTSTASMFSLATSFSGDLSNWDVSNVINMFGMFEVATSFNGDLSTWDVSNVTFMVRMFNGAASFNGDLSNWDVSNVTSMAVMFLGTTSFNGDLSNWNVANVNNMINMFNAATSFNGDLSNWNVSKVTNMRNMFRGATSFNGDLSNWDVSNVNSMSNMFAGATSFNGNISTWNVSNVTSMFSTFAGATSFNGDLSAWNVSNVIDMNAAFAGATSFNGDISSWDVSSVIGMTAMFRGATSFNANLSNWDVSNVISMSAMFSITTSFNGDLSAWNVSNVNNMSEMFDRATSFNGDLSNWNVSNVTNMFSMFDSSGMDVFNYDQTLIGWAAQTVKEGVFLGAEGLTYCLGEDARDMLINTYNWNIAGDNLDCVAYNEPPTAVCKNITVNADNNCVGQIIAQDLDNGSSDPNMDPLLFSVSPEGPYPIGQSPVVLTVEDSYGETDQCSASVTVEDNTPPTPVCLHPDIHFNGEQVITLQETDVWDALASTDNCGVVSFVSMSLSEVDCSQLGSVIPVTVVVEDPNGNSNSCIANVMLVGLPCGFSSPPDGVNCPNGSSAGYDPNTGNFTLTAEGCYDPNYYSNSDAHAYLGTQLCGDGELITQVTQVVGSGFAGLSMREDLSAGSRMLQLGIDGVSLTKRELRSSPGAVAYNHLFQTQGKNWLRLSRSGNAFSAYHSTDGINWGAVISINISMNSCIEVGLYAENKASQGSMTATFENVQVNGVAPLAAPASVDVAFESEPIVNVYPNPANDEAWIDLGSGGDSQTIITVFNHLGQLIQQIPASAIDGPLVKLSVQNWENGLYWIEVRTREEVVIKRLVRQSGNEQ